MNGEIAEVQVCKLDILQGYAVLIAQSDHGVVAVVCCMAAYPYGRTSERGWKPLGSAAQTRRP
jgi:hypothetical protein